VPVGAAFGIDWIQKPGELSAQINGQSIPLQLVSGTPPAAQEAWPVPPTGTLYVGVWPSLVDPLNGLAAELAIYNDYVFTLGNSLALNIPTTVISARNITLPDLEENEQAVASIASAISPETGVTVSKISPTAAHSTVTVVGLALEVSAGSVTGDQADSQGFRATHAAGTADAVASYNILESGSSPVLNLPYLGQFYGNGTFGYAVGDTRLRQTSVQGVSDFFYAERSGVIDRFRMQIRTSDAGTYSNGDGGTYTVSVYPADPATKRPIPGATAISKLTGWMPGDPDNPDPGQRFLGFTFTSTPGAAVAGQPYCLCFQHTGNPSTDWVAMNQAWVWVHQNGTAEPGPSGTHPTAVGSSVVAVSGWNPIWITVPGEPQAKEWHPFPCTFQDNTSRNHGEALIGVRYNDGIWAGFNFQASEADPETISGTNNQLRVRFTVSRATRIVDGLFFRASKTASPSANSVSIILETGAASATSGNGTTIEEVNFNANGIMTTLANEVWTSPGQKVNWIWVPFTTNRTLTLGSTYSLRISAGTNSSVVMKMFGRDAAVDYFTGAGSGNTGADWTMWEDANPGGQITTNGGSAWATMQWRIPPIVFRCVV
jgi:hypothetical protein